MEEWQLQHVKFCEKCNVYKYPNPSYFDMNRPCPDCNSKWVDTNVPYYEYDIIRDAVDDDEDEKTRVINMKKQDIINYELLLDIYKIKVEKQIKCPVCGSTQIQLVNKRWGILTGFFTNKVNRFCVACKTKF